MTLIVAVQYSSGVVMSADSRMLEEGTGVTREKKEKIFRVGDQPILYGGATDLGLLQRVQAAMQRLPSLTDLDNACQEIEKAVKPLLRDAYEKYVSVPGQPSAPPSSSYLFAGVFAGTSAILEVDEHGKILVYGDEFSGVGAVGPYQDRAHLIAWNYLRPVGERRLDEAKLIAYRMVDDCIRVYGAYLGPPIQMWSVDNTELVTEYGTATQRELHTRCDTWRNEEQKVFAFVSQST